MTKKILSLLLVLVMVFALAACGAATTADSKDDAPKADTKKDDAKKDDAAPAADDPMATEYGSLSDEYTIVWHAGGNVQGDNDMVMEAIEDYVNETYGMNITLDVVRTPFGDLGQKMSMVLSSGEDWDICFTSTWSNNYADNVGNGAYMQLDGMIDEYAPGINEVVGNYWAATQVGGKTFGIPNIQNEYRQTFMSIPTKWVEMYNAANPDTPLTQENIFSTRDFEDFWYWGKENIIEAGVDLNGLVPKYAVWAFGCETVVQGIGDSGIVGVYFDDTDPKCTAKTLFDFESMTSYADLCHKWYNDGIVQSNIVGLDRTNGERATQQWLSAAGDTFKAGEDANQWAYWALGPDELTIFTCGDMWSDNNPAATMLALNANCKRPDIVLTFLNIMNTDPIPYNMLCFGIEGYHYTLDDDGCVLTSTENTGYDPNNDWSVGCQFLAHPRQGQAADIWDIERERNAAANVACWAGFVADATNVTTQVANVSVVKEQYNAIYSQGALMCSDEEWADYCAQYEADMYAAGLQDLIDEVQAQVDAWLAA